MRRILLGVVAAFLLAACNQGGGNQEQGTAPPEAAPSDADVSFTQNMIPHHQQAIEMAQLVDTHTDRPELRQLADSIVSSQSQEITQMEGWLRGWGKPATPSEGHGGHGDTEMPGMMSEADMGRLIQSTGTEFDLAFVEMMAAHHQGAIDMANTELKDGSLPAVTRLAQQIIDTQQDEIDQLQRWKAEWSNAAIS
ncbi:MAG: hypothetical protein K0S88_690 [Actinomycetia bacterium]|jgi:uncharacterized protein (DUF305 family)|nr:hypothetical protein [Actinomycetes bacterium]